MVCSGENKENNKINPLRGTWVGERQHVVLAVQFVLVLGGGEG